MTVPGGNVTGLAGFSSELTGKRLELLREIVPGLSRVGIMWDPGIPAALLEYKATEEAARSLHLRLQSVPLFPWLGSLLAFLRIWRRRAPRRGGESARSAPPGCRSKPSYRH